MQAEAYLQSQEQNLNAAMNGADDSTRTRTEAPTDLNTEGQKLIYPRGQLKCDSSGVNTFSEQIA